MQTIKKYANRKLYHTNRKQYITLEGIAALIQSGDHIQVIDNESGEDITASILTQVVLQTRGSGSRLSTQMLTGLIQAGGDTLAGMRRSLVSTFGGGGLVDDEIRRRLDRLFDEGFLCEEEVVRMRRLLLHDESEAPASLVEDVAIPSRSDVAQLTAQVDALTMVVEQLLAERASRDHVRS